MKKLMALLLAALMIIGVMTGCSKTVEYWESYSVDDPNQAVADGDDDDANDNNDDTDDDNNDGNGDTNGKTKRPKKTTTRAGQKTANANGVKKTRAPKSDKDLLSFTPEADAGANYDVKGTVSIAVDTTHPTDSDAMFDMMQKLYPNVKFEFDEWSHSGSDDEAQYLSTRFNLGTNANIIWDGVGMLPNSVMNGYVYPITEFFKADPESKNLSANLVSDYTYGGELYALPPHAHFELVAFNMDLLRQTGLDMPDMEWSIEEKEKYMKAGAELFNKGKGVAIHKLFEVHKQVPYYLMTRDGYKAGNAGWNHATYQWEAEYLKTGIGQFRAWRVMQPGMEGWYEMSQRNEQGISNLQDKLGVDDFTEIWFAGKSLMNDTGTSHVNLDSWDALRFEWKVHPAINYGGQNILHVDHCFITANTPKDRIEACYQALRFMTYSTNGNLARLTMYDPSQKGKYNLHSRIYYPITQSKKVLDKFYSLPVVTECDKYLVRNIPKCSRYDCFKIVPYYEDTWYDAGIGATQNNVTDGLKDVTALNEPIAKANQMMKENQKKFADTLAKVQAEFKQVHGK